MREEEQIMSVLKELREEENLRRTVHTAKAFHLVLSMPGSAYYKIGNQVSKWLSVINECKLNSSTKTISDCLPKIELEKDSELI